MDQRNPRYSAPEGYCPTCEDHTTQIDRFGCCRECGTEVQLKKEDKHDTRGTKVLSRDSEDRNVEAKSKHEKGNYVREELRESIE